MNGRGGSLLNAEAVVASCLRRPSPGSRARPSRKEIVPLLRCAGGGACARKMTFVLSAISHKMCVAFKSKQHGGHHECKANLGNQKVDSAIRRSASAATHGNVFRRSSIGNTALRSSNDKLTNSTSRSCALSIAGLARCLIRPY